MTWQLITIGLTAAFASLLTFFSGFGLGTVLTPVFAFFFPLETAIALTGIVHLLNNLFKLGLTGRQINREILLRFGITAVVGAFLGAWLLTWINHLAPLWQYQLGSRVCQITLVKLIIAILMVFFALFEIVPVLRNLAVDKKYLAAGGLLSGFFGGLSGHQGALRSAFLIRFGLPKEVFIATGVAIACCIDITRLAIYSTRYLKEEVSQNSLLLTVATLSAFAGAWAGSRLLRKVTIGFIQSLVACLLILIALLIGAGII